MDGGSRSQIFMFLNFAKWLFLLLSATLDRRIGKRLPGSADDEELRNSFH